MAEGRVFLGEVVVGLQLILKLNFSLVQFLPQFLEARFLGHLPFLGLFLDLLLHIERLGRPERNVLLELVLALLGQDGLLVHLLHLGLGLLLDRLFRFECLILFLTHFKI